MAAIARSTYRAGSVRLSASVGYGLAPAGGLLPLAFMEADRRVYEDKARRSAGRR